MTSQCKSAPCKSTKIPPDCLIEKFSRYKALTPAERSFLSDLQSEERLAAPNQEVIVQGGRSDYLFVLKSGRAYSHKMLPDGKRQVLEFLIPGDFIGVREFAFDGALNSVTTAANTLLCPFPKSRLDELYQDYPGLLAVLLRISTREQALLVERIVNIGSRSAYQRIAHFFIEHLLRLRAVGLTRGTRFDFPVGRMVLADALGLSRGHLIRSLKQLKQENLLEVRGGEAHILDEEKLIRVAGFEEFYLAQVTAGQVSGAPIPGARISR